MEYLQYLDITFKWSAIIAFLLFIIIILINKLWKLPELLKDIADRKSMNEHIEKLLKLWIDKDASVSRLKEIFHEQVYYRDPVFIDTGLQGKKTLSIQTISTELQSFFTNAGNFKVDNSKKFIDTVNRTAVVRLYLTSTPDSKVNYQTKTDFEKVNVVMLISFNWPRIKSFSLYIGPVDEDRDS